MADKECGTVKIEDAAQILGISRNSAYLAAKTGELPVIHLGRRMLVSRRVIDALLTAGISVDDGAATDDEADKTDPALDVEIGATKLRRL